MPSPKVRTLQWTGFPHQYKTGQYGQSVQNGSTIPFFGINTNPDDRTAMHQKLQPASIRGYAVDIQRIYKSSTKDSQYLYNGTPMILLANTKEAKEAKQGKCRQLAENKGINLQRAEVISHALQKPPTLHQLII